MIASGVTSTGLNTTFTGIAGATLSALAISCECCGDCFQSFRSVKMLAAGDKPDFKLLEIDIHGFKFYPESNHWARAGMETLRKLEKSFSWDTEKILQSPHFEHNATLRI